MWFLTQSVFDFLTKRFLQLFVQSDNNIKTVLISPEKYEVVRSLRKRFFVKKAVLHFASWANWG